MTRKISFFRLLSEDIKKRAWLLAISCITIFLMLPVELLLNLDYARGLSADASSDLQAQFVQTVIFGNDVFVTVVLCSIALLAGLSGFSYLHSREKLDLYHSLPLRRADWFRVQYTAGVLVCAVPYLVCIFLCALIGRASGAARTGDLGRMMEAYIVHMVCYILYYSAAVLATVLTGKIIVSVLLIPMFYGLGPVCVALAEGLASRFFSTYAGGAFWRNGWTVYLTSTSILPQITSYSSASGSGLWSFFTPVGYVINAENGMEEFLAGGVFPGIRLLRLLLLTAAMVLIARMAFQRRKTETAGASLAFPVLETPIKLLVAVPVALGCTLFVAQITSSFTDLWLYASVLFGAAMACAVMEFVYRTDLKEVLRARRSMGAALVISVLLISLFRFDWIGYDAYLPARESVSEMAVYYAGLDSRASYGEDGVTWPSDRLETLRSHTVETFAPIYELAQKGVKAADDGTESGTNVTVLFQLKSGKEVVRSYIVSAEDYAAAEGQLFDDASYVRKLYALYQVPVEKVETVQLETITGTTNAVHLTGSRREEFLAAYKEELLKADYSDFCGDKLVAQISFEYAGTEEGFTSYDGAYPVLKSFTETVAILEELGFQIPEKIKPESVSSVEVYGVTASRIYEDADGDTVVEQSSAGNKLFTDTDDINEILGCLTYADSSSVSWNPYAQNTAESFYSVYLSFTDSQQFVSFYLGQDEAPECVKKAFGQ